MILTATRNFVSRMAAERYYRARNIPAADVRGKLLLGEIMIGRPDLRPGQVLTTIDGHCRYAIMEVAP